MILTLHVNCALYALHKQVVHLMTTVGPLSLHNEACLQWIAQQAMSFRNVCIKIQAVACLVSMAELQ